MRTRNTLLASIGLILSWSCWTAAPLPARAAPAQLKADRRLDAPVTLHRSSIFLGDLLPELSRLTGASIRGAKADDTVGTIELALSLNGQPAREVLEALPALLRSRDLRWEWTGAGMERSPYVLGASERLAAAAQRERQRYEAAFRQHVRDCIQGAALEGAELDAFFKLHPELERSLRHPTLRAGIRAFASLPPKTQEEALAGERVMLTLGDAPPGFREFVQLRQTEVVAQNPNNAAALEPGARLTILRGNGLGERVGISFARWGSYEIFGDPAFREGFIPGQDSDWGGAKPEPEKWIPGDEMADRDFAAAHPTGVMSRNDWVKWIGLGHRVSWITDLGSDRRGRMGLPRGGDTPFREKLYALFFNAPSMCRQSGSLVLVHDRAWASNPSFGRIPFSDVLKIREELSVKAEPAQIWSALSRLSRFTDVELRPLRVRHPVTDLIPWVEQGLLALEGATEKQRTELLSAEGCPVEQLRPEISKRILESGPEGRWIGKDLFVLPGARMRLVTEIRERSVRLGFRVAAGGQERERAQTVQTDRADISVLSVRAETNEFDGFPR